MPLPLTPSPHYRALRNARIDQHMLAGHAVAVAAGHDQSDARHMAGVQPHLQALRVEEGLIGHQVAVQRGLAIGDDAGLRGGAAGQFRSPAHPRHRAHVDDRAAAGQPAGRISLINTARPVAMLLCTASP